MAVSFLSRSYLRRQMIFCFSIALALARSNLYANVYAIIYIILIIHNSTFLGEQQQNLLIQMIPKKNKKEEKSNKKNQEKSKIQEHHVLSSITVSTKLNPAKQVFQIIQSYKDNHKQQEKWQGPRLQISSCGSKKAPQYSEQILNILTQNNRILLFAYDKAICKQVTTVQILKTRMPSVKQHSWISEDHGRNKMVVTLTV